MRKEFFLRLLTFSVIILAGMGSFVSCSQDEELNSVNTPNTSVASRSTIYGNPLLGTWVGDHFRLEFTEDFKFSYGSKNEEGYRFADYAYYYSTLSEFTIIFYNENGTAREDKQHFEINGDTLTITYYDNIRPQEVYVKQKNSEKNPLLGTWVGDYLRLEFTEDFKFSYGNKNEEGYRFTNNPYYYSSDSEFTIIFHNENGTAREDKQGFKINGDTLTIAYYTDRPQEIYTRLNP